LVGNGHMSWLDGIVLGPLCFVTSAETGSLHRNTVSACLSACLPVNLPDCLKQTKTTFTLF